MSDIFWLLLTRASWAFLVLFLCLVLTVLCSFVVCLVGSGAGCSLVPCVLPPFWSSGVCPLVSLVLVPMRFGSLCPLAPSMLVLLCSGSICPLLCPVLVLLRVGVVVDTWMFLLCSIVLFSFVLKDLCIALFHQERQKLDKSMFIAKNQNCWMPTFFPGK